MKKHKNALEFVKTIAKLETGCAPSVGFMWEIIEEARRIENESGQQKLL